MSKMAVIKRIDFLGGFLSIVGLTLFLVALQAGGYTHPWSSAYVLCCLIIGLGLLLVWGIWEAKFAKYPMVPFELFKGQRVVGLSFAVAFIAGANFFSLLNFWPLTISTVWSPDPVKIGLRAISVGFATAIGAIVRPLPQRYPLRSPRMLTTVPVLERPPLRLHRQSEMGPLRRRNHAHRLRRRPLRHDAG